MIRFITFSFGILLLLAGCSDEKSVFSVEIADFKGGNVILMHDGKKDDTLSKVADNLFEGTISVENPNEGLIFFDAYKTSIPLYFEKGMNVKLSINFVPGKIDLMEIMVPEFKYEGDNWDCTEFIMDLQDYLYGDNQKWSNHDLTQISFSQYYKEVLADKDSILLSLSKISSNTFKELKQKYVDDEITMALMRWGIFNREYNADFENWAKEIDFDLPENKNLTIMYLNHYMSVFEKKEGEHREERYYRALKSLLKQQENINDFAKSSIGYYLMNAPGLKQMEEAFDAYKNATTDSSDLAEITELFNHYKKFVPGAPANNFEIEGTDGKIYHLNDFKGKAIYIDMWATWCGPCCLEIPYVAKLVEKFKNDNRIEFISISLDKDKKKWEEKLKEDNIQWRNFICADAFDSGICKDYDINAIPRFLFFDKNGCIISLNAPRPSSENIVEYLNSKL